MSQDKVEDTVKTLSELAISGVVHWKSVFSRESKADGAKVSEYLKNVLGSHDTSKSLGDALEELSDYLLKTSGLFSDCRRNLANQIHQLDHWGEFTPIIACYFAKYLKIDDFAFLGESKNHAEKIDVNIVYKVEGIKDKLGISIGAYFTREGIKGEAFKSAVGVLTERLLQTKKISLVFTKEDFDFLVGHPSKFAALFYEKLVLMRTTYNSIISDYTQI